MRRIAAIILIGLLVKCSPALGADSGKPATSAWCHWPCQCFLVRTLQHSICRTMCPRDSPSSGRCRPLGCPDRQLSVFSRGEFRGEALHRETLLPTVSPLPGLPHLSVATGVGLRGPPARDGPLSGAAT